MLGGDIMRSTSLSSLAFVLFSALPVGAQPPSPDAKRVAFDVASVKPAPRELLLKRGLECGFLGGRFRAFGTVQWLIPCAYEIPAARAGQEILGGPNG
jgi:hypothetical protein